MKKKRILCVGRQNTCRSPMFAAILQSMATTAGYDLEVESVGVQVEHAGKPIDERAVTYLKDAGINNNPRTRKLSKAPVGQYDLVVCMDRTILTEYRGAISVRLKENLKESECIIVLNADGGGIQPPKEDSASAYIECGKSISLAAFNFVGRLRDTDIAN